MASINPAKLIGVDEKKGSLTKGKDADLVVFDEQVNIVMTVVGGRVVYKREKLG